MWAKRPLWIPVLVISSQLLSVVPSVSRFPECKKSTFGSEYRGKKSVTKSGLTCQSWTSQSPHSHGFTTPSKFPDNSMEDIANYCRNPDDEYAGPWCYTTDPSVRWESCDIPDCWPYAECKLTNKGTEYRGSISVTSFGKTCKRWDKLSSLEAKMLGSRIPENAHQNFCRNPDNRDGPWCFVEDSVGEIQYCDVPYCKPSANCKISKLGQEYIGTVSDTRDAIACQRWDEQAPHQHRNNDASDFPDATLSEAENYCRNPDGESEGPWCYTLDPDVRFQFCDVPMCRDCKSSSSGNEYAGTLAITQNGHTCQAWSSQTPHKHSYTDLNRFPDSSFKAAGNYCRNPTGSEHPHGPWCFTTDPEVEWDYCDVPACDESSKPSIPIANHVLFIGIDGLKPSCVPNAPGGAPNLVRLGQEGTSTLTFGRTGLSTVSASGWSNGLCGMSETHTGITANSWQPPWQGSKEKLTPVTGVKRMIPCGFHQLKSRDANIRTAALYDWSWFKYMANKGYPGYVDFESSYNSNYAENDKLIKNETIAYLRDNLISAEKSFTFVYLGNVDEAGHAHGWCETEYMAALDKVDAQVGEILKTLDGMGMANKVLVILSADHGGKGYGHGRMADSDVQIPMYIRGPGVRKNAEFTRVVETQDIVPTAFYALGLKASSWWSGSPMYEAFESSQK